MRTRAVIPALALAGALVATVGASARPQATSIQIGTVLNAAQEVPSPNGAVSGAGGTFSATVTKSDTGASISWQLSFNGLTGNAIAAHIHTGAVGSARPGRTGPVWSLHEPGQRHRRSDPGRARCDPGRHGVREHPHTDEPGGRDSWPAGNDREHLDETLVAAGGPEAEGQRQACHRKLYGTASEAGADWDGRVAAAVLGADRPRDCRSHPHRTRR